MYILSIPYDHLFVKEEFSLFFPCFSKSTGLRYPQRGMSSFSIVKHFDVVKEHCFGLYRTFFLSYRLLERLHHVHIDLERLLFSEPAIIAHVFLLY